MPSVEGKDQISLSENSFDLVPRIGSFEVSFDGIVSVEYYYIY